MAKILFVWELGLGFGHLTRYLDLVKALTARGHQVLYAARDVGNAERIFGRQGIPVYQAPAMMHKISDPKKLTYNISHLLHNIGFSEPSSLNGLIKAWHLLYDAIEPDLVIFDHSPTAMLAARKYAWKKIVSGSGFVIPPPGRPVPAMRYWENYDAGLLEKEEGILLATINAALEQMQVPGIDSITDLYGADAEFLFSFRELDHYPQRRDGNYLGQFSPPDHGVDPDWADGVKYRAIAYLHPYKKIEALLSLLSGSNFSTMVYVPELDRKYRDRYANDMLRFSDEPINLAVAGRECNMAITNATAGTTTALLLRGRPVLCIPTVLERTMIAQRVVKLGAGLAVHQNSPEHLRAAVRKLFLEQNFTQAAEAFQQRYADWDMTGQTAKLMGTIDTLLRKL